jgi:hypothetical protein
MLLPLRRPLARQSAGFSWRNPNIVADTVIPRALRILTLPVLFSLWRALRADGVRVFADGHSAISLLTMVLAVAYGLSWELTCHLKHRRRILPSAITRDTARLAGAALVVGVAGLAHSWEIESPVAVALIGITGFAVSIVLYLLRPQNLLLAEGIALTATAVLCEVVWLVPAPVLLCSALILDERLARSAQQPAPLEQSKLLRPVYANLYLVLVSAGMLVALAKEVLG